MPKNYLIFKLFIFTLFSTIYINASDLSVLERFDIDESYLYNEEFISYRLLHQRNLNKFYKRSIKRGKEIIPILKSLLKQENIDQQFLYLSMVESGFKLNAKSNKKAVGLWQFIPSTARNYNLTITPFYDERLNIINSTISATKYLKKLHTEFGKWYLAILAYNCGEGRLHKAIKKANSDDLEILIDNTNKYLPKETREYIKKILIVSMIKKITKYQSYKKIKYKIPKIDKDIIDTIDVEISSDANLTKIAKLIEMKSKELISLNPNYKKTIKIPTDKIYLFYLKYELNTKQKRDYIITHKVTLGDSLKSIAKKYNTTILNIKSNNSLENDYIILDTLLIIYVDKKIFERIK